MDMFDRARRCVNSVFSFFIRIYLIILILVVSAAVVYCNWHLASGKPHRLRWYAIANAPLPEGAQISEDDLATRLGWLPPEDTHFVPGSLRPVGKYVLASFNANDILNSVSLRAYPRLAPVEVPVRVPSYSAAGLKPGMCLAFVNGTKKVMSRKYLKRAILLKGFPLKAVVPSGGKETDTTLLVEADQPDIKTMMPLIGRKDWIPLAMPCAESRQQLKGLKGKANKCPEKNQ